MRGVHTMRLDQARAMTQCGPRRASGVSGAITKRVVPRAEIRAILVAHTDAAEKACEQRAMQGRMRRRCRCRAAARTGDHGQLRMQILPFPGARPRQKVLAAPASESPRASGRLLAERLPEIQHRHEVGARIGEGRMALIRSLEPAGGSLARILDAEKGRNHQAFPQAPQPRRLDQDTSHRRRSRAMRGEPRDPPVGIDG